MIKLNVERLNELLVAKAEQLMREDPDNDPTLPTQLKQCKYIRKISEAIGLAGSTLLIIRCKGETKNHGTLIDLANYLQINLWEILQEKEQ